MTGDADPDRDILLFSYGTLQDAAVQLALFGRLLTGEPDQIAGYRRSTITVADADAPDPATYPILDASDDADDRVAGVVLTLDQAGLARADDYEGPEYRRVRVRTQSGRDAWVYIRA